MFYFFILLIILILILLYTEIQILFFVIILVFLIFLLYLSYSKNNLYLFALSILLFFLLLPSIIFYIDLGYGVYPYLSYKKGHIDEMKNYCNKFLDRHFNYKIKGYKKYKSPVIYVLNHHCRKNQMIDMFSHLKISGKNTIVVTGGKTRYVMIDTLYSNLNNVKLSKEDKGNTNIFLKKTIKKINEGNNIVIYPEGKYTNEKQHWSKMVNFQTGAFILSKKCNIPIIPVLVSGGNYEYGLVISRDIKMEYLKPIYPSHFDNAEEMRNETFERMNFVLSKMYI